MIKIEMGGRRFGFDISPGEHALFLTIGMAMAQIQNFESMLGQIASVLAMSPASDLSLEELEEALSAYDDKMLGRIIKALSASFNDDELAVQLDSAREKRNFIVHHALRSYADISENESTDLILRIESIIIDISAAQDRLIDVLRNQDVIDISELTIDVETGRILDE